MNKSEEACRNASPTRAMAAGFGGSENHAKGMTLWKLCAGILLLAAGMPVLQGGAFSLDVEVTGPDGLGFDLNPVHCSSIPPEIFGPSASAQVACSGNTTVKTGPFTGNIFNFDGSAQVNAGPGFLNAQATAGALNAPFDHLFHTGGGFALAEVTSHNGFIPGASGLIKFMFTISGGTAVTGDTFAGGSLSFSPVNAAVQGTILGNGTTVFQTTPVPFLQSIPFFYDWDLVAGVGLCASCNSQTPPLMYMGSGVSDYSHTAVLTGISVTDANGQPLTGVTFTSNDGVDYNALLNGSGPSVPEPGSLGMVLGGLAVLSARSRLKSKENEK